MLIIIIIRPFIKVVDATSSEGFLVSSPTRAFSNSKPENKRDWHERGYAHVHNLHKSLVCI